MAANARRVTALVLLAAGAITTLGGLLLVVGNSTNTPPEFILAIAVGVVMGVTGLVMAFAPTPTRPGKHARPAAGHHQEQERSAAPHAEPKHGPALAAATHVIAAVFLVILGLVVGFFYLIHKWFGDWSPF